MKPKSEALKEIGIKQDTAERYERLAKYLKLFTLNRLQFPGAVFRKPEPMQNQCFTCRTICGCLPCEILNESLSFCYPQRCGERRKRHQTTIFFTKSAPLRNWYKYRLRCVVVFRLLNADYIVACFAEYLLNA